MRRETDREIRRPRTSVAFVAAGVAGFAGLVVLLSFVGFHAFLPQSDDATAVLKGEVMAKGNVLLAGWRDTSDSFLTIDQPFYALAVLAVGVRPGVTVVVPAVIAALCVVTGVRMVSGLGHRAATVAGSVTVVAFLALPTHTMAQSYLEGLAHNGTALWSLLAFWALRRNRWDRWYLLAVLLLGTGLVGDLQLVAYAVVPLALGGLVAMLRCRSVRAGMVPVSAAAASLAVTVLTRRVMVAIGTFSLNPNKPSATRPEIEANLHRLLPYLEQVVGARDTSYGTGGVPLWLQRAHVIGALVLVVCFLVALIRLMGGAALGRGRHASGDRQPWRVDDVLTIAVFGPVVAFLLLTLSSNPAEMRYLTASVIFAAVLAGRVVARSWSRLTQVSPGSPDSRIWSGWPRPAAAVGLAVLALLAAGLGFQLAKPRPAPVTATLAAWLEQHHLDQGVGSYWCASIVTLDSRGRVRVRPVAKDHGRLVGFSAGPGGSWFDGPTFRFVVFTNDDVGGVNARSAARNFGPPAERRSVGSYTVLIWSHPFRVAPWPGQRIVNREHR